MTKKELEKKVEALENILKISTKAIEDDKKTIHSKSETIRFLENKLSAIPKHVQCGFEFEPGKRVYGTKENIEALKSLLVPSKDHKKVADSE